jgi:hypothetical protein
MLIVLHQLILIIDPNPRPTGFQSIAMELKMVEIITANPGQAQIVRISKDLDQILNTDPIHKNLTLRDRKGRRDPR